MWKGICMENKEQILNVLCCFENVIQNIRQNISEEQYHETPIIVKTEETAFIRSIALEGKRLVMALDTNYLLSRQEQDAVNKIIEEQTKK